MKPYLHAESSAKKWGGVPSDYLDVHQWFDATKENFPDNRHRAIRHHTQGIFEAERIFGKVIKNSDNKNVSTRDIGEQHVIEDLGFIPTLSDYLQFMEYQDWMGGKGLPPSLSKHKKEVTEVLDLCPNIDSPILPRYDDNSATPFYDGNRLID